jgi:hypothetical protein
MLVIILCLFRFVRLLGSGHQALAVESLALRLQLAAFKRKRKRPVLTQLDRLFWAGFLSSGVTGETRWFSFGRIRLSDNRAIGPTILGPAVAAQAWPARTACRGCRDATVDLAHGDGQSAV